METSNTLRQRVDAALTDIWPSLGMEGGGVEVVDLDEGVVRVRLTGSCTSCPGTAQAILTALEQSLHQQVPEVDYLELVP